MLPSGDAPIVRSRSPWLRVDVHVDVVFVLDVDGILSGIASVHHPNSSAPKFRCHVWSATVAEREGGEYPISPAKTVTGKWQIVNCKSPLKYQISSSAGGRRYIS